MRKQLVIDYIIYEWRIFAVFSLFGEIFLSVNTSRSCCLMEIPNQTFNLIALRHIEFRRELLYSAYQ